MKKANIMVLKKTFGEKLAKEYSTDGLTSRPMLREGKVFYADYAKPETFCDKAWKVIYQYVFALAHGTENQLFYYDDRIKKSEMAICSCSNGLRPVIFKLETNTEESKINHEPVE